jgi:hypothetical protein
MALGVARKRGGLEVQVSAWFVPHRLELAAPHAVADLPLAAPELPRGLLRVEERAVMRWRDGGGSGGDGQAPPPLLQGGREGREYVTR